MSFLIGPLGDIQVTSLVIGLQTTEYLVGACATIWLYDYFITLDREITLVWQSPWSSGKVMYFLNRYTPIIDIVLRIIISTRAISNSEGCRRLAPAFTWFYTTGVICSEIILNMRTWAIWGATRRMFIFLITFTMGIIIASCVLAQWLNRQFVIYVPIPPILTPVLGAICMPLPKHENIWPILLTYIISQAVIVGLALFRCFQQCHKIDNSLLEILFHDGIRYYVYTLLLTTADMVVAVATSVQWGILLELPLRVLTSVFCTHILLNIKGAHVRSIHPSLATMSIGFVVGRPGDTQSESHPVAQEAGDEVLEDRPLDEA